MRLWNEVFRYKSGTNGLLDPCISPSNDVNKEKKSDINRFLGPGPARYQLPPAIGVPNHDPRKWKAPAYTLTGGAKPFKGTGVPGTVYIVINSTFRKYTP